MASAAEAPRSQGAEEAQKEGSVMGKKAQRIDELYHALALALSRLDHFWSVKDPFGTPVGAHYRDEIEWLYRTLHGDVLPDEIKSRLSKLRRYE